MARKTFISYKYSESRLLRDEIVKSLKDDAKYYTGETSISPNMSNQSTNYIKNKLKDMIHSTSVTIVIISPNMKSSNWIDWEIEYSLKRIKRGDRTSGVNGVLGVIMKKNGGYEWFRNQVSKRDGHTSFVTNDEYLYEIIKKNRFNEVRPTYTCEECMTVNSLTGSYISLVSEDDFLKNPEFYIENAYSKSKIESEYKIFKKNIV
ncbi:TIR domain-containing protein [Exiguobacterium undae]|uniref:TIR domain-containing protein n=1 Tax=Exiguobacterium undae TaxID=169177 RepID=UPI00384D6CC6